mmetsp:Transcript_72705/g.130934  ORF Transcript_72705/g.130934 Transcript_72705/m.130934 type:complete len:165 (+) Transcript_72705:2-496(+)
MEPQANGATLCPSSLRAFSAPSSVPLYICRAEARPFGSSLFGRASGKALMLLHSPMLPLRRVSSLLTYELCLRAKLCLLGPILFAVSELDSFELDTFSELGNTFEEGELDTFSELDTSCMIVGRDGEQMAQVGLFNVTMAFKNALCGGSHTSAQNISHLSLNPT